MKTHQIFVTVLIFSVCQWSVLATEGGKSIFEISSFRSVFAKFVIRIDFLYKAIYPFD